MKKHFKIISIISLVAFLSFGVFAQSAFAALVPCGLSENDPATSWNDVKACEVCDFFVLIDTIIDFISITVAPSLALLLIVGGAATMMMSGGSETVYKKGREIITMALVGLFIIWGSWIIIDTIMSGLTSFGSQGTAPNFIPWYTIQCQ